MAWRPTKYLEEGELDNTTPGKVTGWMEFAGIKDRVIFDLEGDFHRDIRGAKIHFVGEADCMDSLAEKYMKGFSVKQTGTTGDITAGLPPQDYSEYPYIEWYSEANGRVVLELAENQVTVIGCPIPYQECEPVSRKQQAKNMAEFLQGAAEALTKEQKRDDRNAKHFRV
jgi:hypothetical protein